MAAAAATVLVAVFSIAMTAAAAADVILPSGASYVFGDSLVDAGNNHYLSTLSRADVWPNGIDFVGGTTGRFTNGRTTADIVGELLGNKMYAPPYLSPNITGNEILYGINYASGGGGILNGTGQIFINRLSMDIQIDYFNLTRKQIDDLLGEEAARSFLAQKAIFSVTIGANDFLNNYLMPIFSIGTRASETPDDFITNMITNFRSQLTRLYDLGARKFVVANVGPIGCIPYQTALNQVGEGECVSLPNQLAKNYNSKLRDLLIDLNSKLPGAKFCLANVYDLVLELVTNYAAYGFKSSSKACCTNGKQQYAGVLPCGPTSTVCKNRSEYVFWDVYHPSEAANVFMSKHMVDGTTKYISPLNLQQLQKL